jgi:hypothetical protein
MSALSTVIFPAKSSFVSSWSFTMDDDDKKVLEALANQNFEWRTISGVAKETELSVERVMKVVSTCGDKIVQSSVTSTSGDLLYTSRDKYKQKKNLLKKVSAVLRNRAD